MAKNNTKTIAIRISEDNYHHIEVQAMNMRMSKNGYIEHVIDQDRAKYDSFYTNFTDENGITLYEHMYGKKPSSKA